MSRIPAVMLMLFACAVMGKNNAMILKDEHIQRLEGELLATRDSLEAELRMFRQRELGFQRTLDQEMERRQQLEEALRVEQRERKICVENAETLTRQLSDVRRDLQVREMRDNQDHVALTLCKSELGKEHHHILELQRSNDILEAQVAALAAQENSLEQIRKELEQKQKRWEEMERVHQEQVMQFHEDHGEASKSFLDETEPHPEVGSVKYFEQLKALERSYKSEMQRRRELEAAQQAEVATLAERERVQSREHASQEADVGMLRVPTLGTHASDSDHGSDSSGTSHDEV